MLAAVVSATSAISGIASAMRMASAISPSTDAAPAVSTAGPYRATRVHIDEHTIRIERRRTAAPDAPARDIVELDLRGVVDYTDYFVVCSGTSDRQVKAIHDAIHGGCKDDHGLLPRRVEGLADARWVLMDYLDVVVHVFMPEVREFYALERLWGEVPARTVGAAAAAG